MSEITPAAWREMVWIWEGYNLVDIRSPLEIV